MGMSRRIFLYSLGIVSLVAVLIIAYFTLMLSHLYANQIETDRLTHLKAIQRAQLSNSDKEVLEALKAFDTPNSVIAIRLPKNEPKISVTTAFGSFALEIKAEEWADFYQEVLGRSQDLSEMTELELKETFNELLAKGKKLSKKNGLQQKWPDELLTVERLSQGVDVEPLMAVAGRRFFPGENDQQFLLANKAADKSNTYLNYVGVSQTKQVSYLVFAGSLTPKMAALQGVIYQSLPMIIAVILVIILLATLLFSKVLVTPLKKLSLQMAQMKQGEFKVTKVPVSELKADEYQQLEGDLSILYQELVAQRETLENQNTKQKMFLAASSHQLKTPVTAALLLIEGMIAEVGKYKNSKKYLPELKDKMIAMQGIINDILLIDQQTKEELSKQRVDLTQLVAGILSQHDQEFQAKKITLENHLEPTSYVLTDPVYLEKIIDNLVGNALTYMPTNQRLIIRGDAQRICFENTGSQLAEEYLDKLFEPFVRPAQVSPGHGLGLYLVAQYAQLLGIEVSLKNNASGSSVLAIIDFR